MPKYLKSDGTEMEVRDMPTPYLLNAMAKADREGKQDVRDMLFAEAGEREKPVWEVRERKTATNNPTPFTHNLRYAMQQTNAEAWKFVKEQSAAYPNRFFVAHESDPL